MKKGITLGKFDPLHKGHELMLETAMAHSGVLTVLIGEHGHYPLEMRKRWVEAFLEDQSIYDTEFQVIVDHENDKEYTKDFQGTVVDEEFWENWLDQNSRYLNTADLVFTSDAYGKEIAERIGAEWFPVDPAREVYNIDATDIRKNLNNRYCYVSDIAKPDVGITVVFLGAESTGKSTMTKRMARTMGAAYAPEWGRIISEVKPDLDHKDFDNIVRMQYRLIEKAQLQSPIAFVDTESTITAMFAEPYLGQRHDLAEAMSKSEGLPYDLYIVLAPTVPLVQDGTRIFDEEGRQRFHKELLERLDKTGKRYIVIDDVNFDERIRKVHDAVIELNREKYLNRNKDQ